MKMNKQGIAILKLLLIISICVILFVVNIIILNNYRAYNRDAVRLADMSMVSAAMNMLYTDQGSYNIGDSCQAGMLLKQQECAQILTKYINLPLGLQDPFPVNVSCSTEVCPQRVCEYTLISNDKDNYVISFHLEKGIEGLSKGCHYIDKTGIH